MRRFGAAISVTALTSAVLVVALPTPAFAVLLPTVSAVSPNRGPDTGGSSITLTGTNLTGATSVFFGGTAGTSVVVGSATSLTVTAPAHVSATIDVTVVTPAGTSLTSAADVYTYQKVLFTDSFANSTTAESMYLPAGTGATNVACLTAGSVTTQTPVPDCVASGGDSNGSGVLRLTSNSGNLEGAAFYSTSLPTSNGLDLTFNTYQYGSSSEADGITFALGATDPTNPSAPVNMGPAGGHLGYSGGVAAPGGVGLDHGYMGFGLDVYGNFTNSQYEGTGCTDPSWLTSGAHAQNLMVRGPGNGMVGYCALDSTLNPAHGGGLGGKKLDNITGTDATRSASLVPVEVALNPSTAAAVTASGITIPAASWAMQVTPIAGTPQLITGALPAIPNGMYPSSWINQATGMPYTLTFGWVASTGGSTDVHAVSNVSATTLQPLSATVFTLSNTDSGSSALTGGSSYTSTLIPTLAPASSIETQPITVAGTYPAGLVPTTISAGAGWTNCLVTGHTFSCTYPASAGTPVTAGTALPAIHVGFTVQNGASTTTNATVIQGQVTSGDALPASGNDYTTVTYAATTATAMTPTQGSTLGGTAVVITGTNMYGVTGVKFDTTAATSISYDSNTQITVYSPAHAAGSQSVVLSYGTSSTVTAGTFTWNAAAPTITSISPASGPTSGGTVVTITGTNFTPTTTVLFGTNAATAFTYVSATQITATTPPGTAGPAVDVTTANGTGSTAYGSGFVYYTTPVITAMTPAQGPTTGFTTVNISGSGFTSVTGVDFGGTAASSYTINSDTSITASTPTHSAGAVSAHLTYGGGTATVGTFTFIGPPTFTLMSPTSGPTAGGTTVTITGTNLQGSAVTVGGLPATNIIVASNGTSLTFVTPAASAGPAAVVIGAVDGTVSAGNYTYVAPPAISGLAPTSGPASGGTSVVITGTGFIGATAVTFGGTVASSYIVNSDTQITAVSPAGSGSVTVGVTTPNGSGTSVGTFTFLPAPTVTSFTPTSGPESGGTSVVITGTGFISATAVHFGATNATTYTVNSATQITATSPAGVGAVTVSVTTVNGTGTSAGTFTYLPAPTITGLAPTSGPETGGTSVVITGTGFTGATAVTFGGVAAASFTVNSATQITALSPARTGAVTVHVTTPNGGGTSVGTFTFLPAPTISGLVPVVGPEAGGTSVVITGTGFTAATAVHFGATNVTSYTVNSATQITATSPAGVGAVTVSVTTPNGTGTSVGTFSYLPAPSISSFTPTSGPQAGGTSVVITGSGFSGATAVTFGGTAATSYTVNSATQITATAPAGVGSVTLGVATANGSAVSFGTFTYLLPPAISGLAPTSGPAAGGTSVVITGTGFAGATAVTFGGVAATGFTVNSATQITATTPAGAGTVTVSVTTANGTGTSVGTFGYLPVPSISGFTPTFGPQAGGTSVVITGTGLTAASAVTFGGVAAASYTVNSATQITATTPAGVGAVSVSVTTANGTASAFGLFSYLPVPAISGIAPTSGPAAGGTIVVITGTGFGGASAVTFGGTAATSYTVDSATQISALSPAGTGAVTVGVTTLGGSTTSAGTFTFVPLGGGVGGSGGGGGGGGGVGGSSGVPTLNVTRIGGADRDATANLISQAMFPTAHSAHVVILARDDVFADALAGSPMATVFTGPVLLTPSASLGASAQDGIVRALNPGDTVYVLGGTSAISDNVLTQIHALGFVTVRIGGTDRYSTAALIAAKLATAETIAKVYLATGINFPDALAAASAAGSTKGVILLTAGNVMPGVTSSWLAAHIGLPQLAVGAQAALAAPSATALAGADRYDTATAVAAATYPTPTGVLLATGLQFPDALAGAAYAAQQGWALLLVSPQATTVSAAQDAYLQQAAATVTSVVILGGTSALPDAAANVVVADMENQ